MKTLSDAMRGVTPLPWRNLDEPFPDDVAFETALKNGEFAVRAANAFPKLVAFVEAQPCDCAHSSNMAGRQVACPRCSALEAALGGTEEGR